MEDKMNTKLACRYAIVRFMPYPEIGEFINIGIILACPKTGFFDFKIEQYKYKRATQFFKNLDPRTYKASIKIFTDELNRVKAITKNQHVYGDDLRNFFDTLAAPREALISTSNIRVILAHNETETLNQLFLQYVEHDIGFAESRQEALDKRVEGLIKRLPLINQFTEQFVGDDTFKVKFKLVQKEQINLAKKIIKPIYLGDDDTTMLYERGDRWVGRLNRLWQFNILTPNDKILFAIQEPTNKNNKQISAIKDITKRLVDLNGIVINQEEKEKIAEFAKN